MKIYRATARTATFIVGLLAACHVSANLITNGSFETPNNGSTSFAFYSVGSTAITGWTVVGAGESALNSGSASGLPASVGNQWIDLTGNYGYDKGLRSDAFTTTIGQTYRISFDLGDYNQAGFGNATLGLRINSNPETLFTNLLSTSAVMDWKVYSIDWIANATSTSLTFIGRKNGTSSNDAGIGLDNVNVDLKAQTVPTPSTLALMAVFLLGIFKFRLKMNR